MLRELDAQTTMMMFLPHLTPKEAAPFHSACKALYKHKNAAEHLSAHDYANYWYASYEKIYASTQYSMESIGRLLVVHYPASGLLRTTVTINRFQLHLEEDELTVSSYIMETKIRFSESKTHLRVAVPVFYFSQNLFTGVYVEMPPVFMAI